MIKLFISFHQKIESRQYNVALATTGAKERRVKITRFGVSSTKKLV